MEDIPEEFIVWAGENGVSFDHEDDWRIWYECWQSGYAAGWNDASKLSQD